MDRTFLTYYESELEHIREHAAEFAALHPTVARNLSLGSIPCPDPYVERLIEGLAFLAARTRLKVDAEAARHVRGVLDALYPDLVGPSPAMTTAVLHPGPQVQAMPAGHTVRRGARFVAAFREGLATRAVYTTAQDVTLWPIAIDTVEYLQDRAALTAAGIPAQSDVEAALKVTIRQQGAVALPALGLDRLDLCFAASARAGALFDAIFGFGTGVLARPAVAGAAWLNAKGPDMVGIGDDEALLPRVRSSFEGYRLLREYFLMPERFHFLRVEGLAPAVRGSAAGKMEIAVLLSGARPAIAGITARDLTLFATPIVNLFERECNIVELDGRASAYPVHPDRTRPRDYEVFRLIRVEDAETEGPAAVLSELHSADASGMPGLVYTTERRVRRLGEDEIRNGQTRTSYLGDDLFISVARPAGVTVKPARRLDIRALCTNRDLPVLDDAPRLSPEGGDPVARVELLGAMKRPRSAMAAGLPELAGNGEMNLDDLSWRLVGQLALNHLSLTEESADGTPLSAMLALYSDRGDPALARHARSVVRVRSKSVIDRLDIPGPICFGKGVEVTLDIDAPVLAGGSTLLLSALLSRLFARHAGINSFVRTRSHLKQTQEEVAWPMTPGNRPPI